MRPPERLTVPTCIGCGAMGTFGTCEGTCREQRLDLVRGAAADSMSAIASGARLRAEAFRTVAAELATRQPAAGDWEEAYRHVQQRARAALRAHPRPASDERALAEPAATATTWWCPDCGGIDAPQPCLGICIWRPTEWVDRAAYERERDRALTVDQAEQRLRRLLRRSASVTPRPQHWDRGWHTLRQEARRALAAPSLPEDHAA